MTIKKWIGSKYSYLSKAPYFKILNKNKVEFYDPNQQIKTINVPEIGDVKAKETKEPILGYDNVAEHTPKPDKEIIVEIKPQPAVKTDSNKKDKLDLDFGGY
jgi:hypothetical protein